MSSLEISLDQFESLTHDPTAHNNGNHDPRLLHIVVRGSSRAHYITPRKDARDDVVRADVRQHACGAKIQTIEEYTIMSPEIEIDVPCGKCGKTTKRKLATMKPGSTLKCPYCHAGKELTGDDFSKFQKSFDEGLKRIFNPRLR